MAQMCSCVFYLHSCKGSYYTVAHDGHLLLVGSWFLGVVSYLAFRSPVLISTYKEGRDGRLKLCVCACICVYLT